MSNRGIQRERAVKHHLEGDDWVVIRAAGSLGFADLIALKVGKPPRLIEVKSTTDGPYKTFGPKDRADISAIAALAGAEAWLVWWPPRGKMQWIPESAWPTARV